MTSTLAGTVGCRNNMSGPTVIASDNRSTHEVVFSGKNDPDGKDFQDVPEEIVRTAQFKSAIRKKILTVVDDSGDPELQQILAEAQQHQSDAFWKRAQNDRDAALAVLEAPADNDLILIPCIGPGSREGAVCGEEVPVRQREAMQRPPLCSRHEALAEQCMRRGH